MNRADPARAPVDDFFGRTRGARPDIGAVESDKIAVDHPPTASAGAANQAARVNRPLSFDASASSDPDGDTLQFTWDFGDGGSGLGATPSHTYVRPGLYQAAVTVQQGGRLVWLNPGVGSGALKVKVRIRSDVAAGIQLDTAVVLVETGSGKVAVRRGATQVY